MLGIHDLMDQVLEWGGATGETATSADWVLGCVLGELRRVPYCQSIADSPVSCHISPPSMIFMITVEYLFMITVEYLQWLYSTHCGSLLKGGVYCRLTTAAPNIRQGHSLQAPSL